MANHPTTPQLSKPFLGQPVEICIVTPILRSTLSGLVQLGIRPFKIFHFTPQSMSEQTFRGKPAEFSIDVAFAEQGSMIWEVMQPVDGPSIMRDFLEQTNGKGGIQQVAFDCADSDGGGRGSLEKGTLKGDAARAEAMRRKGEFEERVRLSARAVWCWHGKKRTCEFMFFDTTRAVKTCFETYVFSGDWEEPEDVEIYPPGQRSQS